MSEFVNVHVGSQLQVATGEPGNEGRATLKERDPLCLGVGRQAIPGTIFASGAVLVGSPLSYTAKGSKPEAALMVARPNANTNPDAQAPSIFKVTSKVNKGPNPIDVVLGDRGQGPVGIQISSEIIDILNNTDIDIVSPRTKLIGEFTHVGKKIHTGQLIRTGGCNESGYKVRSGFSVDNGSRRVTGFVKASRFIGNVSSCSGKSSGAKGFDIEHPIKKGKRIRHICVEGPESAIYIRGRLEDLHIIELPDYWDGLVDYDSITVTLTAVGKPQHLYVKSIDKNQIMIDNRKGDECLPSCHYEVWANRIGPPLITEYDGESPADYPGDQSGHSIAGYDYDVREELSSDDYPGDDSSDAVSNFDENS